MSSSCFVAWSIYAHFKFFSSRYIVPDFSWAFLKKKVFFTRGRFGSGNYNERNGINSEKEISFIYLFANTIRLRLLSLFVWHFRGLWEVGVKPTKWQFRRKTTLSLSSRLRPRYPYSLKYMMNVLHITNISRNNSYINNVLAPSFLIP